MENKNFLFVFLILGIIIGALSASLFRSGEVPVSTVKVIEKTIEKPVEKIVEVEVERPVSPEESEMIAKSKEYYEKAFKLFLTSLGIKLSKVDQSELQNLLENPRNYAPTEKVIDSGPEVFLPELGMEHGDFLNFIKKEKGNLENISSPSDLKEASSMIVKDPALFYARSTFIEKPKIIKKLNGRYVGKLYLLTGKNAGRVDDVDLEMEYDKKTDEPEVIEGTFSLKVSDNGREYSNNRGNGGNGNVRMGQDPTDLILDVGPGWYFHFKNFPGIGNYYSDGKYAGYVIISKRSN